jgi:prevent-host-death family protein
MQKDVQMPSRRLTVSRPGARMVSALTARTQFGQILKRAGQNKERFVVGKRGEPQVVIMGIEEYLRNFAKPLPVVEEIRQEAKTKGLDKMTMQEINREIKRFRRERKQKLKNA